MDYTTLFYWLVVADNAKAAFLTFAIIFGITSAIATIAYLVNLGSYDSDDNTRGVRLSRLWMWWSAPIAVLFILLTVFTPSKKDSLLIVAGGGTLNFLTTDKSAKQIPTELSQFVLTGVKNLAKEAQVDLGVNTQKEKVLESAKEMTTEELLNKMKVDSTFRKLITE